MLRVRLWNFILDMTLRMFVLFQSHVCRCPYRPYRHVCTPREEQRGIMSPICLPCCHAVPGTLWKVRISEFALALPGSDHT